MKAHPVPYALRPAVATELDRLVAESVLKKMGYTNTSCREEQWLHTYMR